MNIDVREEQGVIVFKVTGRMDMYQLPGLDQQIEIYLAKGNREFLLNLIDVTEITSSGVGRLLSLMRTLDGKGGKMALAELSPVCEYVLDLAELTDRFHIYPSEKEALAFLAG